MTHTFRKPMLAKPYEAAIPHSLDGFIAEPKIDGDRCQLIVADYRTVACYSRTGRDMLHDRTLRWLKAGRWPFAAAVLDSEAYAGDGRSTGQTTASAAHSTAGLPVSIALFDLLTLGERELVLEPWYIRRGLLDRLCGTADLARLSLDDAHRIGVVPFTTDLDAMWQSWVVELGGEGTVLKHRGAKWIAGWRSPHWLKRKVSMSKDVVITGLTERATYTRGGYRTGQVALTYGYFQPATGRTLTVGQGIKVGSRAELEQYVGRVAEVRCAGVMPSGALRHHVFLRWRDDKPVTDCVAA